MPIFFYISSVLSEPEKESFQNHFEHRLEYFFISSSYVDDDILWSHSGKKILGERKYTSKWVEIENNQMIISCGYFDWIENGYFI